MTFLEKYCDDHPGEQDGQFREPYWDGYCPSDFKYEKRSKCPDTRPGGCMRCWNREVPE